MLPPHALMLHVHNILFFFLLYSSPPPLLPAFAPHILKCVCTLVYVQPSSNIFPISPQKTLSLFCCCCHQLSWLRKIMFSGKSGHEEMFEHFGWWRWKRWKRGERKKKMRNLSLIEIERKCYKHSQDFDVFYAYMEGKCIYFMRAYALLHPPLPSTTSFYLQFSSSSSFAISLSRSHCRLPSFHCRRILTTENQAFLPFFFPLFCLSIPFRHPISVSLPIY